MTEQTYSNAKKALALINALVGHELNGLSSSEIASKAGISLSNQTRLRQFLEREGYVEQVPGIANRYRLGPKLIQWALAHQAALDRQRLVLNEVEQRYSRAPR